MKPRPGNTTNGRKNNTSKLDWDINTCSTQLNYLSDWDIDTICKNSGRPDWDIDTSHTTRLQETHARSDWDVDTDEITPLGPWLTTFSTSSSHRRVQPRTERESRKTDRTAPKKATAMRDTPSKRRCNTTHQPTG